jgi:quinol monooxygenase YgiN
MNKSSPLTIVAIATAVPGKEESLRAAQAKLVAETVKESGCLRYELHQSLEDRRVLVFVESWESEEQWRAHMQGAAIKGFHASGASNLIQDFTLFRMNLVADGRSA